MASIYFDNLEFYRDLISRSSRQATPKQGSNPTTSTSPPQDSPDSDTKICVRVRPLSATETEENHISGILVPASSQATLFEPRKKVNGAPDANKYEFSLDQVYNVEVPTDTLYDDGARDLVPWIWAGGISTLFAYGQTGSGKTFTVTGVTALVVKDIMAMAEIDNREIHVCCFEILGKKAFDLLDDRRVFSIMEDSFGTTHLVGVQEKRPSTEAEFLSIIHTSSLLRTSAATAKNDQSSRSHAVCRIRTVDKANPEKPDGEFYLVDLAGSEGSQDSKDHSAERLAETKEINTSLSILKDCIRGRSLWGVQQLEAGKGKVKGKIYVPWRSSKLTQVLKHVFETQGERACKTVVVACVAPSIVDSAHSKNTLRYAEMLKVPVAKGKRAKDMNNPAGWTNEMAKKWVTENSGTPPIDADILVQDLSGLQLCKLPQAEFIARCLQTEDIGKEKAVAFFQKLWRFQIDSRHRSSVFSSSNTASAPPPPAPSQAKTPFQQRITPGMFVRLTPKASRSEEGDLVMIMSPAGPEDFNVERGGERKMVCAPVGPSIMTQAYELFVAKPAVCAVQDMLEEVLMEYDFATRYYYMNL